MLCVWQSISNCNEIKTQDFLLRYFCKMLVFILGATFIITFNLCLCYFLFNVTAIVFLDVVSPDEPHTLFELLLNCFFNICVLLHLLSYRSNYKYQAWSCFALALCRLYSSWSITYLVGVFIFFLFIVFIYDTGNSNFCCFFQHWIGFKNKQSNTELILGQTKNQIQQLMHNLSENNSAPNGYHFNQRCPNNRSSFVLTFFSQVQLPYVTLDYLLSFTLNRSLKDIFQDVINVNYHNNIPDEDSFIRCSGETAKGCGCSQSFSVTFSFLLRWQRGTSRFVLLVFEKIFLSVTQNIFYLTV